MREKTYPYEPLRDIIMAASNPPGDRHLMWLVVFLLRLGIEPEDGVSAALVKPFTKKFGPQWQ